MPKKSFKEKVDRTAHLDRFFSDSEDSDTNGVLDTRDTIGAKDTLDILGAYTDDHSTTLPTQPSYYRFNLKLKAELRDYLAHISWLNHTSITQYLNDLVRADMERHQT